jgi:hypothetical protein
MERLTPGRFNSGQIVATPAAIDALERAGESMSTYLNRHLSGDWGDVDAEDKATNERSLEDDERLLSAYHLNDGTKLWVLTEWDRSATTVLLPEDY